MSARFKFGLAGAAEDGALRAVLRQTPMSGDISLAFHREPSFFIAEQAGNIKSQTLIYQDEESGKVTGIGGRSVRNLYVDGTQKTIGYLSMLRLLPEVRGSTALVRGYKCLRHLHGDGEVPYYVTTILSENVQAQEILESGRAGLPTYVPVGTLITYLIPLRKKRKSNKLDDQVVGCNEGILPSAHECLNRWNSCYQFAPSYTVDDIAGRSGLLPNFSLKDLYVWREGNETLGTLGVWNQQSFKQTVVTGYSTRAKLVNPFYNGFARLRGWPLLPRVGETMNFLYASLISSADDGGGIFESLLVRACSDWSGKGYDYLLVGLCEGNKLESVAISFASRQLKSKIYLVHWQEDKVILPQNSRIPHLEVATL